MTTFAATVSRTAYRAMTDTQRARYDFLWELERHYGVTVHQTAANVYAAQRDPETRILLKFGTGRSLSVHVKFGTDAAAELARFTDFSPAQGAISSYIASAVEL